MKDEEKYFNAPIQLLDGFLENSSLCLNDVFDYAIYQYYSKLEGSQAERFKATYKEFGVSTTRSQSKIIENGKVLIDSIPYNSPRIGINKNMYIDFYQNQKSDFDKVCLLGFLAIKSIVGDKPFWKLDNKFWLSRMDGKVKSVSELWELSENIKKYSTEYQTVKIKKELRNNWGLVTYSRYTRGFYVSFDLTLEQLVFEAEKRRKSTKEKQYKRLESEALQKALLKLNTNTS